MDVAHAHDDTSAPTVWVLSELYYPELTSTGHYMTAIAEHLAAAGHRVEVLCGQPTYSARGTSAARHEVRNGVAVHRCTGTTFDKDRLLGRVANTVTLSASTLWTALRRIHRDDIVVAVTNPPTMPAMAALATRVRRARFVPLFHDVLPVVLEVAGGRSPTSPVVRVARAMTGFVLRSASTVVAVGRPQVSELERVASPRAVVVIPNWSDDHDVVPVAAADSSIRHEFDLVDSKVALYAGTFGRANDLGVVLDAATILAARPDITVVLCGDGPQRQAVEHAITERNLTNVVVMGPYGRDRQSDMYGVGDVVVIPMLAGMGRSSMPSRAYNSLAAGLPIVAATEASSELALLVSEHGVGAVVAPGDEVGLAAEIERLLDHPDRAAIAAAAREAATGPCSTGAAMSAWSELVGSMVAVSDG